MKKTLTITFLLLIIIFNTSIALSAEISSANLSDNCEKELIDNFNYKIINDKKVHETKILKGNDLTVSEKVYKDSDSMPINLLNSSETEPNDDPNNPTVISLDSSISGKISTLEDEDWFRFYSGETGKYTILLTNIPSNCDYDLQVYKLNGTQLDLKSKSYYVGNHYELTGYIDGPGYYYIRIFPDNSYNNTNSYTLNTKFTSQYDSNEPNDNVMYCTQITSNSYTFAGTLDSSYDEDWYEFSVNGSGWHKVIINLNTVPDDYDLYLYDSSGSRIDSSQEAGNSIESLLFIDTSNETYRVLVKSYNWSSATPTYDLEIIVQEIFRGFWMNDPISNYVINGGYLYGEWDRTANPNSAHKGLDSKNAPRGTNIVAVAPGEIAFAGKSGAWGNVVVIRHSDPDRKTIYTRYAHLDTISVHNEQEVDTGDKIGTLGSTGGNWGPHLHFQVDYAFDQTGKSCLNAEYFLRRSVNNYGCLAGFVKNSTGNFIKEVRIPGLNKNDSGSYGASYSYGSMNSNNTIPFNDEQYFGINYLGARIYPNLYNIEFQHSNYVNETGQANIRNNNVLLDDRILQ